MPRRSKSNVGRCTCRTGAVRLVIANQTEEERASANERNRQRMTRILAEEAPERCAARLEDAQLRVRRSRSAASDLLRSQQNERDRLRVTERRQREATTSTAIENRRANYHAAKYQPAKALQRHAVKKLMSNVVEATILTGSFKGENVLIPRIHMIPTDMPFQYNRLQFPIRLAFAITVNKAQGQSSELCGSDLETDCFPHGQLCLAFSRVGKPDNLYICKDDGTTKSIAYPQAL